MKKLITLSTIFRSEIQKWNPSEVINAGLYNDEELVSNQRNEKINIAKWDGFHWRPVKANEINNEHNKFNKFNTYLTISKN